jgi:SAM-dependent methyltransferase
LLTTTISKLGLRDHVTVTGYASEETMAALIEAVDVVVSLRSPHVGETSGTLTIALAAGKAVVADSVGTWAELPPDVVERAGGGTELELIESLTDALRRLAASPERRASLGAAAAHYAADELDVHRCMRRFVDAAKELVSSPSAAPIRTLNARAAAVASFLGGGVEQVTEAVASTGTATSRIIAREEAPRYFVSLGFVPPARPGQRLLDIGAFAPMMRVLETVWGYRVQGCNKPSSGSSGFSVELAPSGGLPAYTAEIDMVDVESGHLPYGVGEFDVITCWEVFEHLARDPMSLLWECNRMLRAGGLLVLTTPNVISSRSVRAALGGGHPYLWSQFQTAGVLDRHQREYTPNELRWLLCDAGFSDDGVTTCDVWSPADDETGDVLRVLGFNAGDRGDNLVAVARKVGLPGDRYPGWLYHS